MRFLNSNVEQSENTLLNEIFLSQIHADLPDLEKARKKY